jgi:tRNA threonylcarbamoyladenosine biosynthesis protein TsaE
VTTRQIALRARSPEQTRTIAAAVAEVLRPGDVVSLTGELGAGKTCFVQGAAAALGVAERVTSPSFVLRRDYQGRLPVRHLDVYRLESLREVAELDDPTLTGGAANGQAGVAFIEWGDAMSPLLPADHLEVELHVEDGPDEPGTEEPRLVVLRAKGDDWSRRLPALAVVLRELVAEDAGG